MKKTTATISREQAERMYERLNQLTGLGLRLERQGNAILLCNDKGPAGYWRSWPDAYKSLWSSVQIVERAYMNNVLLADNTTIAHELAETMKRLAKTSAKLTIALAERDLYMHAAVQFARCVDVGTV